jgi:DnaJ like chaperone protein
MGCLTRLVLIGLGWAFGGPIGGIIGYALGGLFSNTGLFSMRSEVNEQFGRTSEQRDFNVTLLVLSAAVMKADGNVKKSELEYVKRFFLENFGQEKAEKSIKMLRDILDKDYNLYEVSKQVGQYMEYSSRLQLLHYLFGIAAADGDVSTPEINVLYTISTNMGLYNSDYESIKSMFVREINASENAYKILGVDPSATDEEVKKAYREMAKKNHPDLVSSLGEEVRQAAEKKFQEINEAYELIKKQRGIN